jgi:acetyl-CoA C-acetyltransferase
LISPVTILREKIIREVSCRIYSISGTLLYPESLQIPVFKKDGTVTAGNASGINDAADALVVASKSFVVKPSFKTNGQNVASGSKGVPIMGIGAIPSVRDALAKGGLQIDKIGFVEANEAFA